jgi:predicted MFS family arabinose efflux permease
MGVVMTAFSASQVLGIPLGLYLSNAWGWHAPFLMIATVSLVVGFVIAMTLKPIDAHLKNRVDRHPLHHVLSTLAKPRHQWGFFATITLATGGFMLMPFGSAFSVHNLGIPLEKLPLIYMATGLASLISGPIIGRVSDAVGKYRTFTVATIVAVGLVLFYTRLGVTPIGVVIAINIVLFMAISGRMIGAQALSSAIPAPADRGAYMSIAASLQQLAGGVASSCAGLLVSQTGDGPIEHYERLGYVVATTMAIAVVLMGKIDSLVRSDVPGKEPGVSDGSVTTRQGRGVGA